MRTAQKAISDFAKNGTAPREPKARGYSMQRLADALGVTTRTLNNWLNDESLGLRAVLRARRHGKHWRLDYPATAREWRAYVSAIRQAIKPFHRRRDPRRPSFQKPKASNFVRRYKAAMGWDGSEAAAQRERDLLTLRLASWFQTMLRRFARLRSQFACAPPKARETWRQRVQHWRCGATEAVIFGRILACELNKPVAAITRRDFDAYAAREMAEAHSLGDAASASALRARLALARSLWPDARRFEQARQLASAGRSGMPEFLDALLSLANDSHPPSCATLCRLLFRDDKHADAFRLRAFAPTLRKVPRGISLRTFRRRFGKRAVEHHWHALTGSGIVPEPLPRSHRKQTMHRNGEG